MQVVTVGTQGPSDAPPSVPVEPPLPMTPEPPLPVTPVPPAPVARMVRIGLRG